MRLLALTAWAWFCIAFMTFEIGVFVNLALGNVIFAALWWRAREAYNEAILAADAWEEVALMWKADALAWQHIALQPRTPVKRRVS
jgi:hypothetical protein